ncbi:MAG: DUF1080 domain-containing protein [Pirellulales bacterium]|nr:DUF1080 domain-containing protein [Pirellulales bacterium]
MSKSKCLKPFLMLLVATAMTVPAFAQAKAQDTSVQSGNQTATGDRLPNTLTDAEKAAGWKLLFDGKTTAGWRSYRKEELNKAWQVVDGTLTKTSTAAGDMVTTEEFAAFELVLEYRISEGGNSGVMYHVKETKSTPWQTGPEIQIQDNAGGHDGQRAGWLYQLYRSEVDATKPAGEWNEIRLLVTPEKCEQYMNGVKYCEYVKGSDDWNARVAKSKFRSMEGFGKANSGFISVQGDHHGDLALRNIRIRVIETE